MCVAKGMVSGKSQAIDAAPIKANASMESLELKVPEEELDEHLSKVRAMSQVDKKKLKENKAAKDQQTLQASEKELKALASRTKNWDTKQENRPGARSKGAKYTSNHTHYSPSDRNVDPARRKNKYQAWQGKKTQLSCTSSSRYSASCDYEYGGRLCLRGSADKHDSRSLIGVVDPLVRRLENQGLKVENILADTGYSSGDNYADMEARGLNAYIPPHGTFEGARQGEVLIILCIMRKTIIIDAEMKNTPNSGKF